MKRYIKIIFVFIVIAIIDWLLFKEEFKWLSPIDYIFFNVLVVLSIIGAYTLKCTIIHYRRSFVVAYTTLNGWRFIAPTIFLLIFASISVLLSYTFTWGNSVGLIFPIGIAVVTLAGFLFTLNKLDDILSRIHSYDKLIHNHCRKMLEDEYVMVENDKNQRGQVIIMANAVTFGNISTFEQYPLYWEILHKVFTHPRISVQVICLDWNWIVPPNITEREAHILLPAKGVTEAELSEIKNTPLGKFYWRWSSDNGTWNDERLMAPYYQAISILSYLRDADAVRGVRKEVLTFPSGHSPLHMMVTSKRALLFHVLDIPVSDGQSPVRIQVIGSETGDDATIQQLIIAFEHHKKGLNKKIEKFRQ